MGVVRSVCFIVKCFTLQLAFVIFRNVFNLFRGFVWKFRGTSRLVLESVQPLNYHKSAQVLRIEWCHRMDFASPYSMSNFICTHERFVCPEYVLQDHINIFFIDGDYAVFSEAEPGVQTWKSEHGAFVREANEHLSKKLISMPFTSLIRLGMAVGSPKAKTVLLFNTMRCGSTLLTQMMEHTGRCVSISEPDGFGQIAIMYRKKGDTDELRQLTSSFINVLCKPVQNPQEPLLYFIKVASQAVVALPFFRSVCPDFKYLFMYRDLVDVSKSIYRMVQVMPLAVLALYGGSISEKVTEVCMDTMGLSGKDYKLRYKDFLCMGASSWAISIKQYLDLRKSGTELSCIRYEDLIADPIYAMKAILRYIDVPEEMAESTLKALKYDSQRKSIFYMSKMFVSPDFTPQSERNMYEVLGRYNVPKHSRCPALEGLIGCKEPESL